MGLELSGLAVGYRSLRRWPVRGDGTVVVSGVNAAATRGEVTAVLGPNGAGKSTLLRTVMGLQPALAGHVRLDGVDVATMAPRERARRAAVVLTDRVDAGLLSATEVAELGRHPHRTLASRLTAYERTLVQDSLARMHADTFAHQRFAELSDGQRQRVLLARALVQEPELLVLDEPSAFLDVGARVDLMALLHQVARERQISVVMSTHEVELALRMCQQVWLVHGGGVRCGTPTELIADGSIAAVFETPTTHFDPDSLTFQVRPPRPL